MKIILTTNIKKLGNVGDEVIVKDGFARNYLFPNKMALRNNKDNLEHFKKIKEEIDIRENEKKHKANELINKINEIKLEFTKEADDKDQLYGAISKKEIIKYYEGYNLKILSDDIKILQPIRSIGEHKIQISPYEGIIADLTAIIKKS